MKQIRTKLAKSIFDLAVGDVITRPKKATPGTAQYYAALNVYPSTVHVSETSNIKDIYNILLQENERAIKVSCLINSITAKYGRLYDEVNDYFGTSYDLDKDIDEIFKISCKFGLNPDDTAAQNFGVCAQNWVMWCVQNEVNCFVPLQTLKEVKKTVIRNEKKRTANERKRAIREYRDKINKSSRMSPAEKMQEKIKEFVSLGCTPEIAKVMAENYIKNLPKY